MKKILLATFLLLASFMFNSCDSSKRKLKADIELANRDCPMDLGIAGEISSVEFDEDADEVIMTVTFRKELPLKMSVLNKLKDPLKRAMLSGLAKSESSNELTQEIAKADSKMTFVMQTEDTNENIRINISKDEVKRLAQGEIDPLSPRELLEFNVTSTNAQCPMRVDEITILTKVSLEGNYFVYNYSINENAVSFEIVKQNKSVIEENIRRGFSDPVFKNVISVCKEANTGILYRYVGDISGNVFVIKFNPSEL